MCTTQGTQDLDDARRNATISTVTIGFGSALVVGGLATYLLSSDGSDQFNAHRVPNVGIAANVGSIAFELQGDF